MALAVGYGYDFSFVQLAVGLAELGVGGGEGVVGAGRVFLEGGVQIGGRQVSAVLRGGGLGEFLGGVLILQLADPVFFGGELFVGEVGLLVGTGWDEGKTAGQASRLGREGGLDGRFVVGGRGAFLFGFEL